MLSEKNWNPEAVGRLSLGIITSLFFGLMVIGILGQVLKGWGKEDIQLVQFSFFTLSFQGSMVVLIGIFLHEAGLSWSEAFGFKRAGLGVTLLKAFLAGAIILVGALELGWLSGELMQKLGMEPEAQSMVQVVQNTTELWRQIFYGVVAILVAPVAEELLFRGVIYPTAKRVGPRLALWGTAFLFAGIHFNLMAFLPLTFVAIMLTILYEDTDNLLAPILAHGVFNLANFMLLLQDTDVEQWLR